MIQKGVKGQLAHPVGGLLVLTVAATAGCDSDKPKSGRCLEVRV